MKDFDEFVNKMNASKKFEELYRKNINFTDKEYILTNEDGLMAFVVDIQKSTIQTCIDYLREYHNWLNEA